MPIQVGSRGHEAAAVARALARLDPLDRGEVGAQLERRLQAVVVGRDAVRVHAVGGDPAAHEVQPRLRDAERGGGIGGVEDQARPPRP